MNPISDYIASGKYDHLVSYVMSEKHIYTQKDRIDVFNYIKRKNALNKIPYPLLKKFEISCGNFDDIKRLYLLKEGENAPAYYYEELLSFLFIPDLYEKAKDLFMYDAEFIDCLPLTKDLDNNFVEKIINDISSWEDMTIKSKILYWILLSYTKIRCFDFNHFLKCLNGKDSLKESINKSLIEIIEKEKDNILTNLTILRNVVPFYINCIKDTEYFDDKFVSKALEVGCTYECIDVVDCILDSGFNKITSGLIAAIKLKNINLVSKILAYNPSLKSVDRFFHITSKEIIDLLNEKKNQNKPKGGKSKK